MKKQSLFALLVCALFSVMRATAQQATAPFDFDTDYTVSYPTTLSGPYSISGSLTSKNGGTCSKKFSGQVKNGARVGVWTGSLSFNRYYNGNYASTGQASVRIAYNDKGKRNGTYQYSYTLKVQPCSYNYHQRTWQYGAFSTQDAVVASMSCTFKDGVLHGPLTFRYTYGGKPETLSATFVDGRPVGTFTIGGTTVKTGSDGYVVYSNEASSSGFADTYQPTAAQLDSLKTSWQTLYTVDGAKAGSMHFVSSLYGGQPFNLFVEKAMGGNEENPFPDYRITSGGTPIMPIAWKDYFKYLTRKGAAEYGTTAAQATADYRRRFQDEIARQRQQESRAKQDALLRRGRELLKRYSYERFASLVCYFGFSRQHNTDEYVYYRTVLYPKDSVAVEALMADKWTDMQGKRYDSQYADDYNAGLEKLQLLRHEYNLVLGDSIPEDKLMTLWSDSAFVFNTKNLSFDGRQENRNLYSYLNYLKYRKAGERFVQAETPNITWADVYDFLYTNGYLKGVVAESSSIISLSKEPSFQKKIFFANVGDKLTKENILRDKQAKLSTYLASTWKRRYDRAGTQDEFIRKYCNYAAYLDEMKRQTTTLRSNYMQLYNDKKLKKAITEKMPELANIVQ
jgi:hypothetical protein